MSERDDHMVRIVRAVVQHDIESAGVLGVDLREDGGFSLRADLHVLACTLLGREPASLPNRSQAFVSALRSTPTWVRVGLRVTVRVKG